MASANDARDAGLVQAPDIAWSAVWAGYGAAFAVTLLVGGWGIFLADKGMWWVANWGTGFLFAAGLGAGYGVRSAEPLNGAFIAVFYFGTVALIVFFGEFFGVLPDPLPGLPRGDSTFYFVWPLVQLVAATIGAIGGGNLARWRGP